MSNPIYSVVLENINLSQSSTPGNTDAWLSFSLMSNEDHAGEVRILAEGSSSDPSALIKQGMASAQSALTSWAKSMPRGNN